MPGNGLPAEDRGSKPLFAVDPAGAGHGALATLAGGVAHDFNNILTVVGGGIHMLRNDPGLSDASRENLDLMEMAAARGAEICRRMLAFSDGGLTDLGQIDLRDIVDNAIRRAVPTLSQGVRLSAEVLARPVLIVGDGEQLAVAIADVIMNAIEATEAVGGGAVALTIEVEDGVARICVNDEGAGMSPETRARASEPFYTTKPPGPGIGLGLAAARGVLEAHRGHIEIASAPGQGTHVSLVVPLAK